MSKITITVSGPVGAGKTTLCAKLEILLKHLGCDVEWVGGLQEASLGIEDWPNEFTTPIKLVEHVEVTEKIYETCSGQNGWQRVTQEEYDRTKDKYSHRIRRVPVQNVFDMKDMPRTSLKAVQAIASEDAVWFEADGCPTERAVLQRFWRAHGGRVPLLIESSKIDELVAEHSEWTPQGYAVVDSHRHKLIADVLALTTARAARLVSPTFAEFGTARERFMSGAPVQMSEKTRELAEKVIEKSANDTRTEEEKIADGAAFICDTRLDLPFAHMAEHAPVGFMMKHQWGGDRGFSWVPHDIQFSEDWERVGLFTEEQLADALERANQDYNDRAKRWRDSFDTMHRRAMKAESQLMTPEQRAALDFAIGYMSGSPLCQKDLEVLKTIKG